MSLDSIRLLDPTGTVYPVDVKQGVLIAAPNIPSIVISDVNPGSAALPAGAVKYDQRQQFRSTDDAPVFGREDRTTAIP